MLSIKGDLNLDNRDVNYNSNTVIYVMPFLVGQHQIFASINYMIDVSRKFSNINWVD